MDQLELVASVTKELSGRHDLRGLFLGGSFGRGSSDEWSDVDLIALSDAEHHAGLAADWRRLLNSITPIVFSQDLTRGGLVVHSISEEWLRCDLAIATPETFGRYAKNLVKPLIDPDRLYNALPDSLPPRKPDPGTVKYLIHEFIRMLGLLPVGAERKEYVTMVLGVGMMRGHLEALLLQDCPLPDPGGILHLSKLLPPDEMQLLKSLPYPGPERDTLIAANFAIARQFMPRARAMAARLGIEWPENFEAATKRRLKLTLGDSVDLDW